MQGSLHEVYGPLGGYQPVAFGSVGRERGVDGRAAEPIRQLRADSAVSLPRALNLAMDEVSCDRGEDERVAAAHQTVFPAVGHHFK